MSSKFDLFGDPIPDNHGKPGANGHVPTKENVNKVRLLLVAGTPQKEIAEMLGITIPTLTKHYFKSGAKKIRDARKVALAGQRAKNLLRLDQAAEKGNVAAIKEMNAILQQEQIKDIAREAVGDDKNEKPPAERSVPRGKKERMVSDAQDALANDHTLNPRMI